MIAEEWIKTKLASKIRNDEIILEEWTGEDKAKHSITVNIRTFAEIFKTQLESLEVEKTTALITESEDKDLGYKKYIDQWQKEGLI